MDIRDHRLVDTDVTMLDTPNKDGQINPEYLVIHYTAGRSGESSVSHFQDPAAQASAHLVIGREGKLWQLVPFNMKAWHAGISSWAGRDGVNNFSIGIELDNAGKLQKVGEQYQAWFGKFYPPSEVVEGRHKSESTSAYWHVFTEQQMTILLPIARLLVDRYKLKDIVGHDDVAPGRKIDPGPAFPMRSFCASVLGREQDAEDLYRVIPARLNIRSGPGSGFAAVAAPLTADTRLKLLEMQSLWARVLLTDGSQIEGWVRNSFIQKI
jgi:N-acetylmuramoyl-L-alanine amidase